MKKHKLQDKVYYSLKGLYFACKEIQIQSREYLGLHEVNPGEFATIKFSGTRRLGHSTAIARLINEFDMRVALVLPNRRLMDSIITRNPTYFRGSRFIKVTFDDVKHGNVPRGISGLDSLDMVIVDNTTYMTDKHRAGIYQAFHHCWTAAFDREKTFFWLFMG